MLAVALCAMAASVWWMRNYDGGPAQAREHADELQALQAQVGQLTSELEEKRLQAEEERANRDQLMRRIDAMSAEIKKLKTELAFFRQQKPGK